MNNMYRHDDMGVAYIYHDVGSAKCDHLVCDSFDNYKPIQSIVIPIDLCYLEKALDLCNGDDTPEDTSLTFIPLLKAMKTFIDFSKSETDYFIVQRLDTLKTTNITYGFIQLVFYGHTVVRNKNKTRLFPLIETEEFLTLLKAGYAYNSELFTCTEIKSSNQFRELLFSLIYYPIWFQHAQSCVHPFCGWSK